MKAVAAVDIDSSRVQRSGEIFPVGERGSHTKLQIESGVKEMCSEILILLRFSTQIFSPTHVHIEAEDLDSTSALDT